MGRRNKKPPRKNAADMREINPAQRPTKKKKDTGPRWYSPEERGELWARLEKIVGAEFWIDEVIRLMSVNRISPSMFVTMKRGEIYPSPPTQRQIYDLRLRLAKFKIYPPPVERVHNEHRECWCKNCRATRSYPAYYVRNGLSYQHHLERQAMADDAIEDDGLKEELTKLRGESPGVVIDMRERLGRRRKLMSGKAA